MRKRHVILFLLLTGGTALSGCDFSGSGMADGNGNSGAAVPRIERYGSGLDRLVPGDAQVEILATGFRWTEGPLWLEQQQTLLFSDVPANTIYAWRGGREVGVWLQPSGYTGTTPRGGEPGSNGLALDQDGNLLLCQHGDRRIARMSASPLVPKPAYETVAARYGDARFNSPNDLAVDSSGNIYFTDPPYGLEQGEDDPARELEVFGVYRIDPDGAVTLLIDDLARPNGIALSPDESILYVANSDPEHAVWMQYRIRPDGSVSGGRLFFDATADVRPDSGLPDGMEVDDQGNLFATGPGGVLIFTPSAELLGTIVTGVPAANVALDTDESALYITASDSLMRVRLR